MDSDKSKLFVGGISRETTEDDLKHHFSKYGDVLFSTITLDRITRIPRGFGFVTFSDISSAHNALQDTHVILGRKVEVRKAIPRIEQQQRNQLQNRGGNSYSNSNSNSNHECNSEQIRTKKIFVGGLPANMSVEEFKGYFEKFGRITDVVVMQDNVTHRPRGFGFITFESEQSVQNVLVKSFHDLNGRQVEVKRAVPREGKPGYYGFSNKIRNQSDIGAVETIYPRYSPVNTLPGFSPLPLYTGDGVYGYVSNPYGGWYPVGGYGGMNMQPHHMFIGPSGMGTW